MARRRLVNELLRCHVPQRATRSFPVVVLPPRFYLILGVGHRQKPVLVQALLAKSAIERFHDAVVCGLPGTDKIQHSGRELSAIVHAEALGYPSLLEQAVEHRHHIFAGQIQPYLQGQVLTAIKACPTLWQTVFPCELQ